MHDILVNWSPQETRVAIIENGSIQELHLERSLERGLVGNVYLGKVARVLPGMQSAFIDIGLERAAFLHVADLHGHPSTKPDGAPTAIEKLVFEGQSLTVQVVKDPIGTKGARLTTQVSIAGRLLVYLPHDNHIGISQRIGSHELREQLRARMIALAGNPSDGGGGFILRTNAEEASDAGARRRHRLPAQDLEPHPRTRAVAARGLAAAPGTEPGRARAARHRHREHADPMRIDSKLQYDALRAFGEIVRLQRRWAGWSTTRASGPIFDLFSIEEEIARALARRVDLKSGGYLIIDQTEALTTDRRQHRRLRRRAQLRRDHLQDQPRGRGGDRAPAAPAQPGRHHHRRLHRHDARRPPADRAGRNSGSSSPRTAPRSRVSGFTGLGLVEMTRKRTRESLAHMLCEPCPTCAGRGQVKTARSVCYDVLREILREARQFDPKEFRVIASASVVEMLLDEESAHLADLSAFIKKPISLSAEPTMNPEQYDIVLL